MNVLHMEHFLGKKSLAKSNRNKMNRLKKSMEFYKSIKYFNHIFHRSKFNFFINQKFQSSNFDQNHLNLFVLPIYLLIITYRVTYIQFHLAL